jgi:hypothetical protein
MEARWNFAKFDRIPFFPVMKRILFPVVLLTTIVAEAQTNITSTNITAEEIMLGNYDPADYTASTVIDQYDAIVSGIESEINPDSLKAYIIQMASFANRNTGADTISTVTGIGAARRWAYDKFAAFSASNDNRLIPSYLQFDQNICGMAQHRNVFAVLPGTDVTDNRIILIEGHLDSRCDGECDIACLAEGVEDNASGSALVLELARVMSKYTFKNTIVFMLTIGEEQGLYGANAFSAYAVNKGIQIEAVLNNDVVGGITCGQTSSPPSCPGFNDIDSTQVRLFSYGSFNSPHKQLSRYIKLQYKEQLLDLVDVPMTVSIMSAEDRVGRGGDHIPFRQDGFPAMRFTAANEHGDASLGTGYTDHQHTSDDIVGVDTTGDMVIDSFFVDFNYLARNSVINGVGAAMAAIGPYKPDFAMNTFDGPGFVIKIIDQTQYATYRVGIRTLTHDWDSVYTITGTIDTIYPPVAALYYVSVASVDSDGIESLFSKEIAIDFDELGVPETMLPEGSGIELLQNKPNPFDESTVIGVRCRTHFNYKEAVIVIRDVQGKEVERMPIDLSAEFNEITYFHGYGKTGIYTYTLLVDGKEMETLRMIFAN